MGLLVLPLLLGIISSPPHQWAYKADY